MLLTLYVLWQNQHIVILKLFIPLKTERMMCVEQDALQELAQLGYSSHNGQNKRIRRRSGRS